MYHEDVPRFSFFTHGGLAHEEARPCGDEGGCEATACLNTLLE